MILKHLKTNKPAGEKEKAYIKAIFDERANEPETEKPMVKLDNIKEITINYDGKFPPR
jgi:hypothetical protein